MSQTVTLNIPAFMPSLHQHDRPGDADLPGVIAVKGDPQAKTATFTVENDAALVGVKETLAEMGYPAAN